MNIKIFSILIFLLGMISCELANESVPNQNNKQAFFDIEAYFEGEINRLKPQKISTKKSITTPQKKEEKIIADMDWQSELALFKQSAINKPTWADKYQVDSTTKDQILHVQYKALEENLKTQQIDIDWYKGAIKSIIIINNSSNQIYDAREFLTYIPSQGYSIKKEQNVTLLEPSDYMIEARFEF